MILYNIFYSVIVVSCEACLHILTRHAGKVCAMFYLIFIIQSYLLMILYNIFYSVIVVSCEACLHILTRHAGKVWPIFYTVKYCGGVPAHPDPPRRQGLTNILLCKITILHSCETAVVPREACLHTLTHHAGKVWAMFCLIFIIQSYLLIVLINYSVTVVSGEACLHTLTWPTTPARFDQHFTL